MALPANFTIGSVHAYREARNRLLFSELLPVFILFFPVYLLVALVISYIFYLFIFFLTWDLLLLARL